MGDCTINPFSSAVCDRGTKGCDVNHGKNDLPIQCFTDSEIGMTMGDTTVKQLPDGTWEATCPIGTLFGSEVDGECRGVGATKEGALEALAKDRRNLNDSLWA